MRLFLSVPQCLGVSFLALCVSVVSAQQPAPQQPTFRASTKLIVTTVVVRNPDGTPVEGLTADDFVVTEDNEPQEIAFVEYQRLDNLDPLPPMATLQVENAARSSTAGVASIVTPGITVPPSGDPSTSLGAGARFRNRRLIILFFDLSDPYNASQERMFTGALAYLNGQMTESDLVAILTYRGGAVRVKQDFTDDRRALANVIDVLANGEDADGDGVLDFQDFSSAFGQNDGEFNVFTTDRKLAALQTAVAMLRPLPEQKSLVFFTSSLSVNGTDNNAQMRATTNAAIRANVQIFPVDARGLVAMAPLVDANRRSPGGIAMFTGALAQQAVARQPSGGGGADQLLHPRPLQRPRGERRQVPPHAGPPQGQHAPDGVDASSGVLCGQGVGEADRRRARAAARRSADAREPDHRHHDRAGAELLPGDAAGVFRPGVRQDPRQRARAGPPPRRKRADSGRSHGGEGLLWRHAAEHARSDRGVVDRGQRGTAPHTADPVRHRLHAAPRQVHPEVSGARRGSRPRWHLPDVVHDSQPQSGADAVAD